MDNRPIEIQAESYITSQLIKFGFSVSKPTFDNIGCDLLVLKEIDKIKTSIVLIQSKGRTIDTHSSIKIPKEYVKRNFVILFYAFSNKNKSERLYAFFQDDILKWVQINGHFVLNISKSFQEMNNQFLFGEDSVNKINSILINPGNEAIEKNDTIVIDGIFLEKACIKTLQYYQAMYPNKEFPIPDLDEIIYQFSKYLNITDQNLLKCYLINSGEFDLEGMVNLPQLKSKTENMNSDDNPKISYKLFKQDTNDFVSFEIEELLTRLLNTENIMLVADDSTYLPYLTRLKEEGSEIVLMKMHSDFGSKINAIFKYVDVMYPLAHAMGLKEFEI